MIMEWCYGTNTKLLSWASVLGAILGHSAILPPYKRSSLLDLLTIYAPYTYSRLEKTRMGALFLWRNKGVKDFQVQHAEGEEVPTPVSNSK